VFGLTKLLKKSTSPFKPVKKVMKNLDMTKYKQKMSCSLKKTQKKNISRFKTVKKRDEEVTSDKI